MASEIELCPANLSRTEIHLPDDFGGRMIQEMQGPHHWVRVGTKILPLVVPFDPHRVKMGDHWVDVPAGSRVIDYEVTVYECVFCLREQCPMAERSDVDSTDSQHV